MGREVAESCARGTFDMRPSGLLLFLTMTTQNSTPYPEHLLCSPQRPMTAIYQICCTVSPLSSWMLHLGASLPHWEGMNTGEERGSGEVPIKCLVLSLQALIYSTQQRC